MLVARRCRLRSGGACGGLSRLEGLPARLGAGVKLTERFKAQDGGSWRWTCLWPEDQGGLAEGRTVVMPTQALLGASRVFCLTQNLAVYCS